MSVSRPSSGGRAVPSPHAETKPASALLDLDPSRLLTPTEAAEALGVKPQTLATWRCRRIGPGYVKLNRTVRYSAGDLTRYLRDRQIEHSEERAADAVQPV